MDGELLLSGYKLLEPVHINLQDVTIVVPQDDFRTIPVIFEFIERYFDKRRFSQQYQFNIVQINNRDCRDDDFETLYVPPRVDPSELFKIAKKSLLGKITEKVYKEISLSEREKCFDQLYTTVLSPINKLLSKYSLICECNANDFWSLSKLIELLSSDMELYGAFDERSQYDLKYMLIDLFAQLDNGKKKLLLLDLPEQGMSDDEFYSLLDCLNKNKSSLNNSIIYTQSCNIASVYDKPLCYHIVKNNLVWGMDDYDEIENLLLDAGGNLNFSEKEQRFVRSLFNRSIFESDYKEINDLFFTK